MTESASLSDVSNIPPTLRGDFLPGKAVDVVEKLSRTISSQSVAGSFDSVRLAPHCAQDDSVEVA
jgi:hypothetical protein